MLLKDKMNNQVTLEMSKAHGLSVMAVPKLVKITINVGFGPYRESKDALEAIKKELIAITGQQPKTTSSKKSISGFKLRAGQMVGYVVTLRTDKMWDFVTKFANTVLPRIRDFEGISVKSFDKNNNLTIAVKEQMMFPEIKSDDIKNLWGLAITLTMKNSADQALVKEYLQKAGFLFKEEQNG